MSPNAPRQTGLTLGKAVRDATEQLASAGFVAARLEAELLLCEAAAAQRTTLYAWPERPLSAPQVAALDALLRRRLAGEPIAYLLRRREFHGLDLHVGPGVLIPRPETELLVDWALETLPADTPLHCADLGTGSGAIALAIARARPRWQVVAVEHEAAALEIARANLGRLDCPNVELRPGDWLRDFSDQALDLIVGNPPYVRTDDPHLAQGDVRFEPKSALTSGADGLDAIRHIILQARNKLRIDGLLLLEHGWQQGAEVRNILRLAGWRDIVTRRDLAGLERATAASPPPRVQYTESVITH